MLRCSWSRKTAGIASASLLLLSSVGPALAAGNVTLGGTAVNNNGVIEMESLGNPLTFGFASFDGYNGMTFSSLTYLGTEYNVTDDDCGGGSPRFSIRLDTDNDGNSNGSVFVYLGPFPNYTGCSAGWQDTGNLLASPDARFDTSQLGGTFYTTYAQANALVGSAVIKSLSIATDAGWSQPDQEQTVWFDNTMINGDLYDYPPPAMCNGMIATIVGTEGTDVLKGTSGPDVIAGLGGNDVIQGKGGDDVICGGLGNNILHGDDGNDWVSAEGGRDILSGGNGDDTLLAGDGTDVLTGGRGDDDLDGGGGTDVCSQNHGTGSTVNCER